LRAGDGTEPFCEQMEILAEKVLHAFAREHVCQQGNDAQIKRIPHSYLSVCQIDDWFRERTSPRSTGTIFPNWKRLASNKVLS
jgi:hypothetical protein